jgi:hypothetical protein
MNQDVKALRKDKQALYAQIVEAGGVPRPNNMFLCPFHDDKKASSWIKRSKEGLYYFRCFTCGVWGDVYDIEARNKKISIQELFKEKFGHTPVSTNQYYYKTISELVASLDAIEVEEINPYTNPENGNIDLVTIRYLERGKDKKSFCQGYQTDKGFVKRRPQGLTPLFNRTRLVEADTVIYVEGEKAVRFLTDLGFVATTGAGGSQQLQHDFSPLAGKTVYLWPDYDKPGQRYMEQVYDALVGLDPQPTVLQLNLSELDLNEGDDVVDVCNKIKEEGGLESDCKSCVEALLLDAKEPDKLEAFDEFLNDMRTGKYTNLPIQDFPILTNEALMFLNKKVSLVYGGAGLGKSLWVGKLCDDLALAGHNVARLQLEDELEQHLLRSFAQRALRSELAVPMYHFNNPVESKLMYEQFRPILDKLVPTIISGEDEDWNDQKVLNWIETQLKSGKELVVVDPISVIAGDKIWLIVHRIIWNTKKLLAQYPNARILFVSHPNSEGQVYGGQNFKRFCHTMLVLDKFKSPKQVRIIDRNGEEQIVTAESSIGIAKTRYGRGNGLEIAVKLNSNTLCLEELGVILEEIKTPIGGRAVGRNLEENVDNDVIPF